MFVFSKLELIIKKINQLQRNRKNEQKKRLVLIPNASPNAIDSHSKLQSSKITQATSSFKTVIVTQTLDKIVLL